MDIHCDDWNPGGRIPIYHHLPPRSLTVRPWKLTFQIGKDRLLTTIFQGQLRGCNHLILRKWITINRGDAVISQAAKVDSTSLHSAHYWLVDAGIMTSYHENVQDTVDGSGIRLYNHVEVGSEHPIIYKVLIHPRSLAGFLNHQQYHSKRQIKISTHWYLVVVELYPKVLNPKAQP